MKILILIAVFVSGMVWGFVNLQAHPANPTPFVPTPAPTAAPERWLLATYSTPEQVREKMKLLGPALAGRSKVFPCGLYFCVVYEDPEVVTGRSKP
jgi:hypothetical protein